jgi:threonine/homoserine/homoserine lactone efflux protein
MLPYLLQGITLGFAAGAQPGPFQTYLITQTLANGWRKTLIAAFAPLVSDGFIIILSIFVLKQIPASMQRLLYIAGGIFIFFLAWSSYQQWHNFDENVDAESKEQSIWKAATMNFLSPGPYVFWSLVSGPILLRGLEESLLTGITFLLAFYGAMISLNIALIVILGQASQKHARFRRTLLIIATIALFIFGVYQLWLGVVR